MTSPTETKSTPQSVLLVFGKPTSADLPLTSWFHIEDRARVNASAQTLKLSVLEVQTDGDDALLDGVHEGVLKSSGRMVVGSVTPEVYKRIEQYAAKISPAPASTPASVGAGAPLPGSEQNTNIERRAAATSFSEKAPLMASDKSSSAPDPWAALRVGSHVAAKYWYDDGHANGWWIAVITAIEGGDFIIRWPDEPKTPPLKIERKHVAILHPDFDATREWDRKS